MHDIRVLREQMDVLRNALDRRGALDGMSPVLERAERLERERRAMIQAVEEADNARDEARDLLEQNRAILAEARSESASILAEARKVADDQIQRAKDEAEVERQRRLEETRKQIDAETARAIDQIRGEVADLTLEATQRVVGKVLDSDDQRRLIGEAIEGLDFSALERGRS